MKFNFRKINEKVGDKLAYSLSTMAMFYGICFLVITPLMFQTPIGLVPWMQYLVSVFFQGVALPVLGYVSRKGGEKQEKLLTETHAATIKEVESIKEITKKLNEIVEEQHKDSVEEREYMKKIIDEIHEHLVKQPKKK